MESLISICWWCSKCSKLLAMDKQTNLLLPPVHRPYWKFSFSKILSNISLKDQNSDTTQAYHTGCLTEEVWLPQLLVQVNQVSPICLWNYHHFAVVCSFFLMYGYKGRVWWKKKLSCFIFFLFLRFNLVEIDEHMAYHVSIMLDSILLS